jgi:predicted amidohydrolase
MKIHIQFFYLIFIFGSFFLSETRASDEITIASVQYPMEGNFEIEPFLSKLENFIKEAAEKKADLVLFPEWITLDTWPLKEKKTDREVIDKIVRMVTPQYLLKLKTLAKKYNVIIAGGSTAKKSGSKTYNSATVFFPDGRMVEHRKIYLTDWEQKNGISPGKTPTVFKTKWGKIALLICYDIEFPDVSVDLSKQEIDIILVPSMTESESGKMRVRWTSQSRAIEHTSFVVISPTVGTVTKDWIHFGNAVFLTPQLPGLPGVLNEGPPSKSDVLIQRLDIAQLRTLKKSSSWRPSKQIRNRK